MSARTISELAGWDTRRNQRSSKPRFSSSNLDAYSTVLHLGRDPLTETHVNTRLPTCVDTSAALSQNVHRQHPVSNAHINTVSPSSPLTVSSSPSPTPTSSVRASSIHVARPSLQRGPNASLSAPSIDQEVIDLTVEDTDDELSVTGMLIPRSDLGERHSEPGPSRGRSASVDSSPLPANRSLFTPPPRSRKRARILIDHVAVPSFPKGLSKSDYRPISEPSATSRDKTPIMSAGESSPASGDKPLSFLREYWTPVVSSPSRKGKGKEREDVPSSPDMPLMRRPPTASIGGLHSDASYTTIPIQNWDSCPYLTTQDFVVNTRFHFAHAWRGHVARLLQAPRFDWMIKFQTLGSACVEVGLTNDPSPRIPGTTGWVTTEELRDWEPIPLESSPRNASIVTTPSSIDVDVNQIPPTSRSDDALTSPNDAFDPGLPSWNAPREAPAMDVDMENDMDQYFNGLGSSPSKHPDPPRQQLYATHAFRPHFLQFSGQVQMNSNGSEFPHLDPQLIEKGDNEPFFRMPPSPLPENAESFAPGPTPDCPFESASVLESQPDDDFAGQALGTDNWSFHDDGDNFPQGSPSRNQIPPIALGTIDPSLLGGEQPPASLPRSKVTTIPKVQPRLPEPIIYIRRPMDSSSLPLVSGKRPVQIKFRDQEAPPTRDDDSDEDEMMPSGSRAPSSSVARHRAERSTGHAQDGPLLSKRYSVPSLKRRKEHLGYESDALSRTPSRSSEAFSDFIPEASKPKPKLKLKLKPSRSSGKDREASAESRNPEYAALLEKTSCHQCRNTTLRPKMSCSNDVGGRQCARRFCDRCIMRRYPEITFDQFSAGFLCPVCTNTCNCSVCSRSRGEEFISMREKNFAESRLQTRVTLVRDVGQPIPHTTSPAPLKKLRSKDAEGSASVRTTPTPEPGTLPAPPMFWAHVYGMEGERMGSAFISHERVMGMQNHGPSPPPPPKAPAQKKKKTIQKRDKTREKARGPRVFIGRPLKSWGVHAVRDLEPSIDLEALFGPGHGSRNGKGKGKGKAPQRRVYIGNPAALRAPYRRMPIAQVDSAIQTTASSPCSSPMLDSDGSLTPLSELEADPADYWPQPEVGECCLWAPPLLTGTVAVDGVSSSALLGLSGGLESAVFGSGSSGVDLGLGMDVGMGGDVDMCVDLGLDMTMEVDANPTTGASADGEMQLSEEDLARAISAALAALDQPVDHIGFPW